MLLKMTHYVVEFGDSLGASIELDFLQKTDAEFDEFIKRYV